MKKIALGLSAISLAIFASCGGKNEQQATAPQAPSLKVNILEKQDIALYKAERESLAAKEQEHEGSVAGQTCYCGSLCGAMKEMVELKKKLQVTEQKYSNLKRAFKSLERSKVRVGVAHRDSPCTIS